MGLVHGASWRPESGVRDRDGPGKRSGPTDLLLVIALDDRAYGYWKGDGVGISDAGLEDILSKYLEAGLRATDYPGAVFRTANALASAMASGSIPPEKTLPRTAAG